MLVVEASAPPCSIRYLALYLPRKRRLQEPRSKGLRWPVVWNLILCLALLTMPTSASFDPQYNNSSHFNTQSSSSLSYFAQEDPDHLSRYYKLYNRCSGGWLQTFYNKVNARGLYHSPLAEFIVKAHWPDNLISITSRLSGKYLCFNKRRRVTTRFVGKHSRCRFIERLTKTRFTEFESAWEPGLYLGFNRKGRFLDPTRFWQRRHCFQYVKFERIAYNPKDPTDLATTTSQSTTTSRSLIDAEAHQAFVDAIFNKLRVSQTTRNVTREQREKLRHWKRRRLDANSVL